MASIDARPPVVLLHGWPVTQEHWRHLIPALTDAGLACVPLTLPGLGSRPLSSRGFRKRDLATGVLEELTARGIERFALMGHDWGATVAVHVAAQAPTAVAALVVEEEILPGIDVDLARPGADHYPAWHGPFNREPGLAEALVPGKEAAYYGSFLRASAGPAGLDPGAERAYIDAYSAEGVLEAGLGYYRTREADLADTGRLVAAPIPTPTLAIGGRYAMAESVAQGMRALADDVTGAVLEHSGHYPAEQEPRETAELVIEFLARRLR